MRRAVRYIQGLGFSKESKGYPTLMDSLKQEGIIDKRVFAFHLDSGMSPTNPPSVLSFGSWDLEKYALSPPIYLPIVSESGRWGVRLNGFKVNETLIPESSVALIHSWGVSITIPYNAHSIYSSTICKIVSCTSSVYVVNFKCPNNEEKRLPNITFLLGSHEFSLPYYLYIRKHDGKCESIVRLDLTDYYTIGIPLMFAYYTIFDMENEQIGFARSVNSFYSPSLPPIERDFTLYWIGGALALLSLLSCVAVCYIYFRRIKKEEASNYEPFIPTKLDWVG